MPVRRKRSRRKIANRITDEEFERMHRWLSPLPTLWQRWKDAGGLDKADRNVRCRNDADLAAAIDYLDALARCTTDDERAAVQLRWPEISQARAIFDADTRTSHCGREAQMAVGHQPPPRLASGTNDL